LAVEENVIEEKSNWQKIWDGVKPYILALVIAFGVSGIIIGLLGYNVIKAYQTLLLTSFTSQRGIIETLKKFIPLTFAT